ncbi:Plasma-membrane_choline transporter and transmembrane domain-containing protein [Hexamita inflata]|uniref:Plasma-membrane choline transporter and transmembrane domain-containing protein n=1 Tax=Hexamita inflata TaxID=28002 RepID=A0AA86NU75_9EUKA|nr:Plasma-membrane choline transporter and transmembrane domain-containing protein [Hexamita inflata]
MSTEETESTNLSESSSEKSISKSINKIKSYDEQTSEDSSLPDAINPEQFQRLDSQLKIERIKSKAVLDALDWLNQDKCRKCRDWFCLIVYLGCWAATVYFAFFSSKYKVLGLSSKAALYIQPSDQLRRQCGKSISSDSIAVDYSDLINTPQKSAEFCKLYKQIAADSTLSLNSPLLVNFDCNLLETKITTDAQRKHSLNFYNIMRNFYGDMTEFDLGYATSKTVCIRNKTIQEVQTQQIDNQLGYNETTKLTYQKNTICLPKKNLIYDSTPKLVNITANVDYVCHREIFDVISFLRKQNFNADQTDNRIMLDTAINTQFLNQSQMTAFLTLINAYNSKLSFLQQLCVEMPSDVVLNFYQLYSPLTFVIDTEPKCIVNYNNAIKNTDGTLEMVAIFIQYLGQAFSQMIPTAVMELDLCWKNLLISLSLTIVFTVIYQICMYFLVKLIIYISLVGVVAGAAYFTYYIFNYAAQISVMNSNYYKVYGSYNSTYQLQQILFYCGGAIMIILLLLIFSISCVFINLADAIAKTIKVAQTTFKKIWGVSFLPFILIVVCLLHIVFFIVIIFLFQTTGKFDARVVTFNFINNNLGEGRNYDKFSILIMVFYVLMLVHGIFLCVNLIEFVVSTSTIQHYFFNRNHGKFAQSYVFKSIGWMFAQFGSLVFEAFLSVFLIWLRPIFSIISNAFPHLPEAWFLRILVIFSRKYISLCSRETIYSIGFTGQSTFKSAKKWKEFMHADRDIAQTLSKILSIFLTICNLCISLTTWSILKILRIYTNNSMVQSVNFIWIQIISFILGYLISSFVTNLTDYILSTILYCWSFEAVVGANKIICEPEDFRNLRQFAQEQQKE